MEFAENKLEDIYRYYSEKAGKKVAQNLVSGIVEKTIGIEKQPEIGQIEIGLSHRPQNFRYLVFGNYKIIYWINRNQNRIEIANIFDTRQDPIKIGEIK